MDNPLMPQGAPTAQGSIPGALDSGAAAPAPGAPNLFAQYQKLLHASAMIGAVRSGLDSLVALADTVTPEDVVGEAGKLVALGLDPVQIAGMLADMPQEGDLLVEWLAQQDQQMQAREAQLAQVTQAVRHDMGVNAMQGLMMHHFQNTETPAAPPAPTPEAPNA